MEGALPQQWPASLQACSPARAQLGVARTPAAVGFHLDAVLATRFVSTPLFRGSVALPARLLAME